MYELTYLLLGIILVSFVFPVISEITEVVISYLEILRAKNGTKVTKENVKINKLSSELNEVSTHVIGFQPDTEEEYYEEEEEEEYEE